MAKTGFRLVVALPRYDFATWLYDIAAKTQIPKKNQAGLEDRPVLLANDFVNNYAVRLRRMRSVLAPNGSSSNAPAIIVVGSGTGARLIDAPPVTSSRTPPL